MQQVFLIYHEHNNKNIKIKNLSNFLKILWLNEFLVMRERIVVPDPFVLAMGWN